jgi:hypothetical protein
LTHSTSALAAAEPSCIKDFVGHVLDLLQVGVDRLAHRTLNRSFV